MKRTGIVCVLLILISTVVLGQAGVTADIDIPEPVSLTLSVEEAVDLALENNLSLLQEDLSIKGKKRIRDTAWNVFVPTVSANATLTRFKDEVPFMNYGAFMATDLATGTPQAFIGQYQTGDTYMGTLGMGLDFQLVLTPQLWYGYKATVLNYESGLLSKEQAKSDLETNIKKQFYGLIVQKEQIDILETQLAAIEKRYQQALDNYSFGFVDEYTTLSVKVNLENFKPQIEMARLGYNQAEMAFKLALGINLDSDIVLDGQIEIDPQTYEASSLVGEYISGRTDLQQLMKTIETLENTKKIYQGGLLPRIILGYGLSTSFDDDPWGGNWFSPDDWSEGQTNGVFSLVLNLQLSDYFPFSSTANNIKGMDDAIGQTRAGLSMAWQAARMEIFASVEQLNNAVLSIKAKELNVDLASRAYSLAEESYNAGGKSLLDVEDAEDGLKEAQFQLLNAKYNYITALLNLEAAINAPLSE